MAKTLGNGILGRFLSKLRFPQAFALLGGLFLLDFLLLDPIPFLDEMVLAVLTLMFGMWKERGREIPHEGTPFDAKVEKNITDRSERL